MNERWLLKKSRRERYKVRIIPVINPQPSEAVVG